MADEIEELVKQLKEGKKEGKKQLRQKEIVNDENVNEYVCEKISKLVQDGVETIDILKSSMLATATDAKEIESFSILFKSVVDAVEVLNKINLQNKKVKAAKELKEMDHHQKQLGEGGTTNNTNILISTREEIVKNFLNEVNPKNHKDSEESIEAEFEEENE